MLVGVRYALELTAQAWQRSGDNRQPEQRDRRAGINNSKVQRIQRIY
jgi:hypothetical protein